MRKRSQVVVPETREKVEHDPPTPLQEMREAMARDRDPEERATRGTGPTMPGTNATVYESEDGFTYIKCGEQACGLRQGHTSAKIVGHNMHCIRCSSFMMTIEVFEDHKRALLPQRLQPKVEPPPTDKVPFEPAKPDFVAKALDVPTPREQAEHGVSPTLDKISATMKQHETAYYNDVSVTLHDHGDSITLHLGRVPIADAVDALKSLRAALGKKS